MGGAPQVDPAVADRRRSVQRIAQFVHRQDLELAARGDASCRLLHVAFHFEDVLERGVTRFALGMGEARIAQETLGIGERDCARVARNG